uniref:Retrotransposon gag domain-containing protein n=1 Tax=Lactuca sativa TaxID=4236 RepID=A0A9R1WGL1_LACSA|nr:hypothetical protein LSAT_V11C200052100 [Lactuca sativa]
MPRKSSARLNLNQQSTPQQPQPPPEINPSISSAELEEIIAQRIPVTLANGTRSGVRIEGNAGTARMWIEKIEPVFQIIFCPDDCKVRFAAYTFTNAALTWWNSHVNIMGIDAANSMKWEELKMMMVEDYCPREEIQKIE